MTTDETDVTSLRSAWAALPSRLKVLEPMEFTSGQWSILERLHANFNDRKAHIYLPMPIALFRKAATTAIFQHAKQFNGVTTVTVGDNWLTDRIADEPTDALADYARRFNDDVDEMMRVLVPSARYRKGHYAYGRFTVAAPHGLHTDHSAEDPDCAGEPICIARIETLGTHYVTGDYTAHDARTERMLRALRYWTAVPEGEPDDVLKELLRQGTLRTIPVNQVMLMVAGNSSADAQITQHIAARPPEGGLHSAFFQRQYKLT